MADYLNNIPISTNKLKDSVGKIRNNFTALDDVFGVDHVKYSGSTADRGKHNSVTTLEVAHQTTSANEPKLYAVDLDTDNVIQVSRSPNNGECAGITALHGTESGSGTKDIITMTNVDDCILEMYAFNENFPNLKYARASVMWKKGVGFLGISATNGAVLEQNNEGGNFIFKTSGEILQLFHSSAGNNYWTLHFRRLDP